MVPERIALIERTRLGMEWELFVTEAGIEYFVTQTFKRRYADRTLEEAMRFFVVALDKRLPRKFRHTLTGFVCAERITKKAYFEGTYHFHFLLCNLNAFIPDAYVWLCQATEKIVFRIKSPTGKPMMSLRNIMVQPIDPSTEQDCAAYEVKDIHRRDRPAGSQILFIKNGSVEGRLLI